jgi:dihydroneopterin aldolase
VNSSFTPVIIGQILNAVEIPMSDLSTNCIKSRLLVKGLELRVILGWPKDERLKQQTVLLDLTVDYPQPPKACTTDELTDTYCYSMLAEHIREKISDKSFRLIENLSCYLYSLVKAYMPSDSKINVAITKHPHIPGLKDGISFSYGDI